jgi:drug/metabolite transporter (DMT)-like permease
MGELDNIPHNPKDEGKAAQDVLRKITQDLKSLHQELASQLSQDITWLQGTKHRLLNDLEVLEREYEALQAEYNALQEQKAAELTRQQIAQQQLWAKRLAQALATHLESRLAETIYSGAGASRVVSEGSSLHNAYQLLSALDDSLNQTLHCVEEELKSYRKNLSATIDDMRVKEKQGEELLDALVSRISEQLQRQKTLSPSVTTYASSNGQGYASRLYDHVAPTANASISGFAPVVSPLSPTPLPASGNGVGMVPYPNGLYPGSTPPVSPSPPTTISLPESAFRKGLIFIIISTLALSFHNVMVGIIGYGGQVFGKIPVAGIFPLNIPNSLMLLWLRMLVVLPMIVVAAGFLYPKVWQDIRKFLAAKDKRPLFQVIASGSFLFMSQVLIYKAISEVGPGVAVTSLFMYPLVTVPLAWGLFGDRPTPLRAVVMFAITIGIILTALPRISMDLSGGSVSLWGIFAALLSSCAFALYLISMQLSFRKLHPIPVSLIQFTTIFVLASLILILAPFFGLQTGTPSSYSGLYLAGLILGGLTLLGYLFNNFGVRLMGAAQASIVASTGPVLTAILAYLITPGEKSTLQFIQWIGVTLVTLGVLALSLEKLGQRNKPKPKEVNT